MTDKELREGLQRMDMLLGEYRQSVMPFAEELERRHNEATGHKHKARLGCYEEGIETVCLHAVDEARNPLGKDCYESGDGLEGQFFSGLKHISLRMYF